MNLIREYIGLLAKLALTGGESAPERIVDAMQSIPTGAVTVDVLPVWDAMYDMASRGTRPTLILLRRSLPGHPEEYWHTFAPTHPDLKQLQTEIVRGYQRMAYREFADSLIKLLDDPLTDPEAVRMRLYHEAERPIMGSTRATKAADISFTERLRQMHAGTLPYIKTPWTWVNDMLGGGLFVGGDLGMSTVLGYTGAGKTAFAIQIATQALMDGHTVLYFSGESTKEAILQTFARLHDYLPKSFLLDPARISQLEQAETALQKYPLYIYDRMFDSNVVRSLTALHASEIRATSGKLLLTIVDNLDHMVEGGQKNEWQLMEQAAEGIAHTTRRLEIVHSIILTQSTDHSYNKGVPPGLSDFARSRLVGSHASNVFGLYRRDREAKVLISKSRGSENVGEAVFATDQEVGTWEV